MTQTAEMTDLAPVNEEGIQPTLNNCLGHQSSSCSIMVPEGWHRIVVN